MKKKLLAMFLGATAAVLCAFGLSACGGKTDGKNGGCVHTYNYTPVDWEKHIGECILCGDTVTENHTFEGDTCTKCVYTSYDGTYCLYKDGVWDEKQFLKLDGRGWSDNSGGKGSFDVSHGDITLSISNEYFASGEIEEGLIKLYIEGEDVVYSKIGYTPDGKVNTFTVTFEAADGKFPDGENSIKMTVAENGKVVEPEIPLKTNYAFAGWFKSDGATAWDFSADSVTANTTLKAQYTKALAFALNDDKNSYKVIGIGALEGEIEIPEEFNRKPVTAIAENAFAGCAELTKITIADSVTEIGKNAFAKCPNLVSAVIGDGVEVILESAFENCAKLDNIVLGANVNKVCEKAFYKTSLLTRVDFNGTASDWAEIEFVPHEGGYNDAPSVGNPIYGDLYTDKTLKRALYIQGELLEDADLSDAEYISDNAFIYCNQLKSVTVGANCAYIGKSAFYHCDELTDLSLSDGLKRIDEQAFYFCKKLSGAVLPESVKTVGKSAFKECSAMTVANLRGVASVGEDAFANCANITTLLLGNSVTEIGVCAFYQCEKVQSVALPSTLLFIGESAFIGCSALNSVTFGNTANWTVNKVGDNTVPSAELADPAKAAVCLTDWFLNGKYGDLNWEQPSTLSFNLSSDGSYYTVSNSGTATRATVEIPYEYNKKPVKVIEAGAFENCRGLTQIIIPDGVTSIGGNAFRGCSSLNEITIPDSVTYIGDGAFSDCAVVEATIPVSCAKAFAGSAIKKVVITSGTDIADYAFADCTFLESVTLCDSIESIGINAFDGCEKLKYNVYGNGLYLGTAKNRYFALIKAKNTDITFCAINGDAKFICSYAFRECVNLAGVTIPDGVTRIDYSAFYGCDRLTEITIPDSVTKIGDYAFAGCEKLKFNEYGNALYLGNDGNKYLVLVHLKDEATTCKINGSCSLILSGVLYWSYQLESIEADENNSEFFAQDGILYDKLKTRIICIPKAIKGDVNIPYGVTEIGECAFESRINLTGIFIPDSVTEIGGGAFYGCENLTSVRLSENITKLTNYKSSYAMGFFKNCISLERITIPESVTEIGDYTFSGCSSLKEVNISAQAEKIGYYAFGDCTSLTEITVPDGVTYIGSYAFGGCTSLSSVKLPKNLKQIYDVFSGCSALTEITIPDSVTEIGNSAFSGCTALAKIIIPDGVTNIGECAFKGCTALTEIVIPKSVKKIYQSAFEGCASLARVNLTDGLQEIYSGAFKDCTALTEIIIPNSVIRISSGIFEGCNSLESVTIPFVGGSRTTTEDAGVFGYIFGYTVVPDEESVPEGTVCQYSDRYWDDEERTFIDKYYCYYIPSSLKTVVVGDTQNISEKAFYGCSMLGNIDICSGVTAIGSSAFGGCTSLTELVIPDSVTQMDGALKDCNSLESLTLPLGNTYFGYVFGGSDFYDGNTAVPASLKKVTVTGNETIKSDAFYGCGSIESIILPDTLKEIGSGAFWGCTSLKGIVIPDGVTSVGSCAFNGCTSLGYIKAPFLGSDGRAYLESWFGNNGNALSSLSVPATLKTLIVTGSELSDVALNDCNCIKTLGINKPTVTQFYGINSLESVIIGKNVTKISAGAFRPYNELKKVYYAGTADEWSNIEIGYRDNTNLTNATRYYYSETKPTADGNWWHYGEDGVTVVEW